MHRVYMLERHVIGRRLLGGGERAVLQHRGRDFLFCYYRRARGERRGDEGVCSVQRAGSGAELKRRLGI